MLLFALILAPVAPSSLSEIHQRDIACVAEIAVLADAQKRGVEGGTDVRLTGRRWAGIVGDRIVFETGQPRELVAFAMQEAAQTNRTDGQKDTQRDVCIRQMLLELNDVDGRPLPKPVKAR